MRVDKDEKEIIADIYDMPIFYGLELNEQIEIAKLLHYFSTTVSEDLVYQEKQQNKVYFIVEGQVEATFNYDKRIKQVYEAKSVINIIALYNSNHTLTHLVSHTNTSGYYMNIEDFAVLQRNSPQIAFKISKNILKSICRELRKENASTMELTESNIGFKSTTNFLNEEFNKPSKETRDFLHTLPIFQKFSDEELHQLLENMKELKIPHNNILFSEGEPGRSCFIIVKGNIEVSINQGDKNIRLAICGPGSLLGEVSLIHLGLRSATCIAREDLVVLELHKNEFNYFFNTYSPLSYKFLEVITHDLISKYVSGMSSSEMSDKKILMEF